MVKLSLATLILLYLMRSPYNSILDFLREGNALPLYLELYGWIGAAALSLAIILTLALILSGTGLWLFLHFIRRTPSRTPNSWLLGISAFVHANGFVLALSAACAHLHNFTPTQAPIVAILTTAFFTASLTMHCIWIKRRYDSKPSPTNTTLHVYTQKETPD